MAINFKEESIVTVLDRNSEKIERLISRFLKIAFKLSTFIGGGLLMIYCFTIGYLPAELSIGDAFIFISIFLIFGFLYGLTVLSIKLLFNVVLSIIITIICKVKISNDKIRFHINILARNFKFRSDFWLDITLICIWLLVIINVGLIDFYEVILTFTIFLLVTCLHQFSSLRIKEDSIKYFGDLNNQEYRNKSEFLKLIRFFPTTMLIVFLGIKPISFVESSLQILGIAKNDVTIHVQNPYDSYIEEHGIDTMDSNFGKDYAKIDNVDITMHGVGDKTVLKFDKNLDDDDTVNIVIPEDKLFIIDR